MNVYDSSLQHLALDSLSLSFLTPLNNLWTWVTAALSFWKIRAAASPKPQLPPPPPPPPPSTSLNYPEPKVSPSDVVREAPHQSFAPVVEDVDGVRSGKFTAYYYICEDIDRHRQCEAEEGTREDYWEERSSSEWWERWDKLLRMRIGESKSGWYAHQDLTELNGNVVRLWDAHAIPTFTPESIYTSASSILPSFRYLSSH